MHAQTAAPIRTKLGTSLPSVPGVVIGRSNFGSGCPKTRENQKKQKKRAQRNSASASKTPLGIQQNSAQNQRSRTLKSKGRDATSSSYLQIQNDVDNVFLNENSECQTYLLNSAAQNQRLRTLKSKSGDATFSSYLQIQNDVDNVFLNFQCQTYFLQVALNRNLAPSSLRTAKFQCLNPRADVGVLGQTSGLSGKRRGSRANIEVPRQTSGFPGRPRVPGQTSGSPGNAGYLS